jgi:GH24 family phage-related lysozyme (muramidase)
MSLYNKKEILRARKRLGQVGFQNQRVLESKALMERGVAVNMARGKKRLEYIRAEAAYEPAEKIKEWQQANYEVSKSFKDSVANEYKVASSTQDDMLKGFSVPTVDPDSTSTSLVNLVAGFESFRETPYDDYKQQSIGYGSKASGKDQVVTEEQAKIMLLKDLSSAKKSVEDLQDKYGYKFTKNQIDALTSFTQNLGRSRLNQLMDGGKRNIQEIAKMMLEYNKAGGKKLDGLVARRLAEQKLFKGG